MRLTRHSLFVTLLLTVGSAQAASVYTETFTGSLNGWTSETPILWRATNDLAEARFNTLPIPFPELAIFAATSTASFGAFTGDYDAANIGLIGFDFMAVNALPVILQVEWRSGSNTYFKPLADLVSQTGVWYSIAIPMRDRDLDGWVGSGDAASFRADRTNVTAVAVAVQRRAQAQEVYRVDRFFALPLHEAVSMAGRTNLSVVFEPVMAGRRYRVETAEHPGGPWVAHPERVADGVSFVVELDATNHVGVIRLTTPNVDVP